MPTRQLKYKDERRSNSVGRFIGNTLAGRLVRSTVQTVSSTANIATSLSPWGDNNVVTLPNVRYRDVILFAVFSGVGTSLLDNGGDLLGDIIGNDLFTAEVIDPSVDYLVNNTVAKYAFFQIVEQAIDTVFIDKILPEEEKVLLTTSICTLQCVIKHKLMGDIAKIELLNTKPAQNPLSHGKGWFCPYLFASSRNPTIPRSQDFSIAQFFGPFLGADYALAHKLLSQCSTVFSTCDSNPEENIDCNRVLMALVGITPYRYNMWSSSRRPGAAKINFHLLNGCPALVVPVNIMTPLMAWSPVTLSDMQSSLYNPSEHHRELCDFLDSIVSKDKLLPWLDYQGAVARVVSMLLNAAMRTKDVDPTVLKRLDPKQAGIVFFRY